MPTEVKSSLYRFLTISKFALVLFKILTSSASDVMTSLMSKTPCENSIIGVYKIGPIFIL